MLNKHVADVRLIYSDRDVYEPSDDSFALVDAILDAATSWSLLRPRLCLEVGSGSGYVITSLSLLLQHLGLAAHCIATDINPAANAATRHTLAAHKVTGVDVVRADLLQPLLQRLAGAVDLLIFNPPYVPTPDEELHRDGIARAWAGGKHGRAVIDRFLPLVKQVLSRTGQLFMVTVADNKPAEIIAVLEEWGLTGRIVLRRSADEEALCILQAQWQNA